MKLELMIMRLQRRDGSYVANAFLLKKKQNVLLDIILLLLLIRIYYLLHSYLRDIQAKLPMRCT